MKGNKKQLTDKEIEEIIEKKYSKKLPHTKDYIREQLKKDPNYKCKFSMVKQDFIDEYYRSREGKLCPSFDFTDVPEFIKSTHEYVILICLDKDSKGNQIGEYKTCYKQLVNNGEQHYELRLGSIIYKHYTEEEALEVFQKQLVRDKNVRKYCKENNIILVEIPYSYNTYKKISVLLFNILIENKDPEDIINIPKIKYRKED